MTVHIHPGVAVIFVISVLVTYLVYRWSCMHHSGPSRPGDLVGSITAGAVVFAVLCGPVGLGEEAFPGAG